MVYFSPIYTFLEIVPSLASTHFLVLHSIFFFIFLLWQISSAPCSFQIHCRDWPFIWKINLLTKLRLPYVLSKLNRVLFFTASKFLQESVSLYSWYFLVLDRDSEGSVLWQFCIRSVTKRDRIVLCLSSKWQELSSLCNSVANYYAQQVKVGNRKCRLNHEGYNSVICISLGEG